MEHTALVITESINQQFAPTMKKGCEETRKFAERSNIAMDLGGVSIVVSSKVKLANLREAAGELIAMINLIEANN